MTAPSSLSTLSRNYRLQKSPPEVSSNYVYICWLSFFSCCSCWFIYLIFFLSNLNFAFIRNPYTRHYISNHRPVTAPHAALIPTQTGNSYANLLLEVRPLGLMLWKHSNIKQQYLIFCNVDWWTCWQQTCEDAAMLLACKIRLLTPSYSRGGWARSHQCMFVCLYTAWVQTE